VGYRFGTASPTLDASKLKAHCQLSNYLILSHY